MRAKHRLAVPALLATLLAGCATTGAHPPALADLSIPDEYSSLGADGGPLQADVLDRCWNWLDDPILAALVEPPADGAEGVAPPAVDATAGIARRYIDLRARQTRIENARAYLDLQLDNQKIAQFRQEAQLVTPRDVAQADAERAQVAASIPAIEAEVGVDIARIAVLSGQAPAVLRDRFVPAQPIPIEPASVAVGAPSDLVERREDLRKAAAKAAGPFGSTAASREAYRVALLAALEEVENARSALAGSMARARGLAEAVSKAEALAVLTRQQYREGQADYEALSKAELGLLATRDALADARAARVRSSIDLCVALGGGRGPVAVSKAPMAVKAKG